VGDSPALLQLQAFVVANGIGYALTGTAGEGSFATAEPELRAVVEGFRLSTEAVAA
jgi:hypothetical protein